MTTSLANELALRPEPAIRFKIRHGVLGEDPETLAPLRDEIRTSNLVRKLLENRDRAGRLQPVDNVYAKWQGAHWVMATLADIGYPRGDTTLEPVRDQLLDTWLQPGYFAEFECATKAAAYRGTGVPIMQGRHRRCASQQSNALWSIMKLGLMNDRSHELAERLLHWQWPDGGWNCDKNPDAQHSSFMESILPLRALALYATEFGSTAAAEATKLAAEIFLKRHLYLGEHNGELIKKEFGELHYPLYWHYDVLHGLKVMAEAGKISDPRCAPALEFLMSKRLTDGGWSAGAKYYKTSHEQAQGHDYIDWGGTSKKIMNPWITADVLTVFNAAGVSVEKTQTL